MIACNRLPKSFSVCALKERIAASFDVWQTLLSAVGPIDRPPPAKAAHAVIDLGAGESTRER